MSFKLFSWLLPITVNADSRGEVSAISPTPILPTTYQKSNFAYSAKNCFFDTKTLKQPMQATEIVFLQQKGRGAFPTLLKPRISLLGLQVTCREDTSFIWRIVAVAFVSLWFVQLDWSSQGYSF